VNHARKFLERVLLSGLGCGVLGPEDILRHVTPVLLARHLPKPLLAKLISAGLAKKRFDAALIVEVVGVPALAANMPLAALWKIVDAAAAAALSGEAPVVAKAPSGKAEAAAANVEPAAKDAAVKAGEEGKGKRSENEAGGKVEDNLVAKAKSEAEGKPEDKGKSKDKAAPSKDKGKADHKAAKSKGNDKAGKDKLEASRPAPVEVPHSEVDRSRAVTAVTAEVKAESSVPANLQPPPLQPPPEAVRKPNVSSRPETQPGRVAKADVRVPLPGVPAIHNDVTLDTTGGADESMDFDVDTMVGETPPLDGAPPPRLATIDPEVEHALAGLEMEEVILDEFEIGEEEILDESVKFDDASSVGKK